MESDRSRTDRDESLRALLVRRATRMPHRAVSMGERVRIGIVTAIVLASVVALSLVAIRFNADLHGPAGGGLPASGSPVDDGAATPTIPAGQVLGRYSSDDGPIQKHTIHPNGLAIATVFSCRGKGTYLVSIAHDGEEGGDGGCGSSGGSGNKGVAGDTTVTIRTDPDMVWTFTVVGIPETYVTPRPIPTPTDTSGTAVRYCTADDLRVRFSAHAMPDGVTAVSGGELVFTNRTEAACALAGYPEVRFLDGGTPLGSNTMNHTDERSSTDDGLHAVVLRPGGNAYSQVDWYLPGANASEEGACVARTVTSVQVDLAYDLASPGQTGTLTAPIGRATACLNGAHGALGHYGQISSTVFVDYSLADGGRG